MTEPERESLRREKVAELQKRPEPERQAEATADYEIASTLFEELLGAAAVDPPIDRHSALLGDPRLSHPANAIQRARIAREIQSSYGNGYFQKMVGPSRIKQDSITTFRSPIISTGGMPAIQRDLTEEDAADLAEELHRLFRARRRDYTRLDEILVNPPAAEVLQVYQRYEASYGQGSFIRSLDRFISGISAREGQSPEEAQAERDSYWDRYAAKLYDAGVGEIQREFHANRPVPVTDENERRWRAHWQEFFEDSEASYAPLARWILARWDHIHDVEEIERRGWMPSRRSSDFRASFGVLSQHPEVGQEGERAGLAYWATIRGRFFSDLDQIIGMMNSYHESYVAAHFPVWNTLAPCPPVRSQLEQAIRDWHAINSNDRLPYPEVAGWVSNWMTILNHWQVREFIRDWELLRAGMSQSVSAGP